MGAIAPRASAKGYKPFAEMLNTVALHYYYMVKSQSKHVGFDSDTDLWATHALECQECNTVFPVAYSGKAIALREYGGVAELCPTCDRYTPCEEP